MSSDLISVSEDMWGNEAQIFNTKVEGIYDATTARHGGYLVDIKMHPKLKKYGAKTNNSNIRAFEEDYEAMKVLWIYPELLQHPEKASEWLTAENVIKYDKDNSFLKDFPKRNIIESQEEEEYER
jgi:hypothetical protein